MLKIELTDSEKAIQEYIQAHPQEVISMSVRDLADASFTSPSTVVRLYQKMEFSSFNDFKIALALEADGKVALQDIDADFPDFTSLNHDQMIDMISNIKRKAIRNTEALLKIADWKAILDLINKASSITLYGVGFSNITLKEFEANLRRIGYNASCIDDSSTMNSWLSTCSTNELFIIVSYSGKSGIIAAKKLKKRGIRFIAVSSFDETELSQMADQAIKVEGAETGDQFDRVSHISSVTACEYALDVLYAEIFTQNYYKNREKLSNTITMIEMQ